MTNRIKLLAIAAVAAGSLVTTTPQSASAQGKSGEAHGKSGEAHGKVQSGKSAAKGKPVVKVVDARDDHEVRKGTVNGVSSVNGKNGNGPAFCRSGAGHPVFGRSWCVQKGFGLGNARWGNADWGSVVFGRNTSRTGTINSGTLSDVLGRVIFGRLQTQANQYGGAPLTGRWVTSSTGPLLLQVQSGSRPLAEFVDSNRDGRTDVILLNLSH